MSRTHKPITLIEGKKRGELCTVYPSVGGKAWDVIHLEASNGNVDANAVFSACTNVLVTVVMENDTTVIRKYKTLAELKAINSRHPARNDVDGRASFWFYRPEMETHYERNKTVLGTIGVKQLKIEFEVDDIADNDTFDISAYGTQSRAQVPGLIEHTKTFTKAGIADLFEYDHINRDHRIMAVHVFNDGILDAELLIDDYSVFKLSKARMQETERDYGRVPFADAVGVTLDYQMTDTTDSALVMEAENYKVAQMRLSCNLSGGASQSVRGVVEYLADFNAI